jgi:hypothetical protein
MKDVLNVLDHIDEYSMTLQAIESTYSEFDYIAEGFFDKVKGIGSWLLRLIKTVIAKIKNFFLSRFGKDRFKNQCHKMMKKQFDEGLKPTKAFLASLNNTTLKDDELLDMQQEVENLAYRWETCKEDFERIREQYNDDFYYKMTPKAYFDNIEKTLITPLQNVAKKIEKMHENSPNQNISYIVRQIVTISDYVMECLTYMTLGSKNEDETFEIDDEPVMMSF